MKDDKDVQEFLKALDVISIMGLLTMIHQELGIYPENIDDLENKDNGRG